MQQTTPRLIQYILSIVLILVAFNSHALAFSGAGDGTPNSPYEITSCSQFQEINNALSAYYTLQNSIDCSGTPFTDSVVTGIFTGNLNGRLHSIAGISITVSSCAYKGIFSQINTGAVIENLIISNAIVNASNCSFTGMLVGYARAGQITNVSLSGSITGGSYTGGMIGLSDGSVAVSESFSSVSVSGGAYPGGFIADMEGGTTITDSYFAGTVSGSGYQGGLVGTDFIGATNSITNCYVSGSVSGTGYSGGIAGALDNTTVAGSFANGSVTGQFGGAAFGSVSSTVTDVFFDATTTGRSTCGASSGCTAVNIAGSSPNYFLGNNTNQPMSSWDFNSIWAQKSNQPPELRAFVTPTPTHTATPIATATSTATATPTETPVYTPTTIPTAVATITPPVVLPTATPVGTESKLVSRPSVKVKGNKVTVIYRDSLKNNRNYFVMVVNAETQKLYKKIRFTVSRGRGTIEIRNIPKGLYRMYVLVIYKNGKMLHSRMKYFQIK